MVHDLIKHLVAWIYLHPNWAELALFLLSAVESLAVIGFFIPGTIVMTAVGIFIGAGLLPYWPMVLCAASGSLFGDALSFTLGYYVKDNLNQIWPFRTRQHWLTKGQQFFQKHGGKSIFFARFIGPIRALAPIIAGAMRMPASKFYIIDSLSAFVWGAVYLLPGILLGEASLELPPDITEHLFRFVFLTLIILIVGAWITRLLVLHVNEVIKNALSCLWTKMKESSSFTFICHLFRHHEIDHPRGQLGTLFVFVFILTAFILLTVTVCTNNPALATYNLEIHHYLQSFRMQWVDNLMLAVTVLGQKEILASIVLAVCVWLSYKRYWRATIFWIGSFLLGAGAAYALKAAVHFHRPNQLFEAIDGFSYPSGHVVLVTILYGGLAYLMASHHSKKYRWIGYTIASLLIAAVACSRAFLGVHWLSDIVGSILLGWLSLLFMAFFYQRHPSQNIQAKKLLPAVVILQFIFSWVYLHHYYAHMVENYQLHPFAKTQIIETKTWWKNGYPAASMMANNRFGAPKERLNIQWAGNEKDISALLTAQGWKSALEPHNWVLEIQHPENKTPVINLELKTRFFEDKKPKLIFYKPLNIPHTFMVLQLWKTNITLSPFAIELLAGKISVNTDMRKSPINFNEAKLMTEFLQSLNNAVMTRVTFAQTLPSSQTTPNDTSIILIRPVDQ
ncbi:MAG: VTT domain-containing protein [Gammaproteobacteria bacterium]|nr:VTT domain-containing protein [Gammaproteobacteria bacterium]